MIRGSATPDYRVSGLVQFVIKSVKTCAAEITINLVASVLPFGSAIGLERKSLL
jgi:hypothetical protein